jgi:hypothetical protein
MMFLNSPCRVSPKKHDIPFFCSKTFKAHFPQKDVKEFRHGICFLFSSLLVYGFLGLPLLLYDTKGP